VSSVAKHNGFSLTEVLMAVGILSVGMMLIATMFPVGIYLTTVASERTMAAIVADEAFAKIQLYGIKSPPPDPNLCLDYEDAIVNAAGKIDPNEFSYPSVDPAAGNPQYYWSALCRKLSLNPSDTEYLITVFVSRKTSPNLIYRFGATFTGGTPRPKKVVIETVVENDKLNIKDSYEMQYVNPPTTILWNGSGRLYRVVDRVNTVITLDRAWVEDMNTLYQIVWLIPPPETGGRNAYVEVYQRIMRF
jgi:prepilin-type N-terminal cleavage/methylation domain-containing protein